MKQIVLPVAILLSIMACKNNTEQSAVNDAAPITLITLDPGHFHAALVQKEMYSNVDSNVYVYGPAGQDLDLHLKRIESYNSRSENPTHWKEHLYTQDDFFQKMVTEKKGNVVVMSGNNLKKSEYILNTVDAGLNVLADKPMAINQAGFEQIKTAFAKAAEKKVMLYDIMTERFEINTMLQRDFSQIQSVFGNLEQGTLTDPAIIKESVHYFYKFVSGSILQRPAWFLDVSQQGEGIVDVTTHLVDLVQWAAFPDQALQYDKDVEILQAKRWPTPISLSQFSAVTRQNQFPEYFKNDITHDSILQVYSNGAFTYKLKGVHAKVSVTWGYQAPEGTGDTHYSVMRGTRSNLVIRQGAAENYKPVLYIEPVQKSDANFEADLTQALPTLQAKYPGIEIKKSSKGWQVMVPEKYNTGHEAHFGQVMERFLEFLKVGKMPDWEVPNMITKYYTTTAALALAKKSATSK